MQTTCFLNITSISRWIDFIVVRFYECKKRTISDRGVQDKCQI
ncbi:hypothetical protein UUU_35590 [Klebsiella pneumoniae subsp. pneumoniae DSM 30104 = JCM 1662 = NBRC 14940]|nr:hypothetical protein UUU_35590 [Klebsiella pneumoniae subsp. pneumoniae DSM 30104 = JCM 1662 = NBRC 14940]